MKEVYLLMAKHYDEVADIAQETIVDMFDDLSGAHYECGVLNKEFHELRREILEWEGFRNASMRFMDYEEFRTWREINPEPSTSWLLHEETEFSVETWTPKTRGD